MSLAALLHIKAAHAFDFVLRTGIPGPLPPESGILGTIQNAYLLALGFAGVLALGSIVYGAVLYTVSRGNPTALADAWDRIVQALIGVLLLVGAGTILSIVNPGLLSLELPNLQPVTPRTYQAGTVPTPPGTSTPIENGPTDENPPDDAVLSACYADKLDYTCQMGWSKITSCNGDRCQYTKGYKPPGSDITCTSFCANRGYDWHGVLQNGSCKCALQADNATDKKLCYGFVTQDLYRCQKGWRPNVISCDRPSGDKPFFQCVYSGDPNYKCYRECPNGWEGLLDKYAGGEKCDCTTGQSI